jgi:hypothetical protein
VRRIVRAGLVLGAVMVLAGCQPILYGGPSNVFGNDLPAGCTSTTSTFTPCPNPNVQPNVWAAINGPYSNHADGDPYATKCAGQPTGPRNCDAAGVNPIYRPAGYMYAITVPSEDVGSQVTVAIYDPAFGPSGSPLFESNSDDVNGGFSTSYQLFDTASSVSADQTLGMNSPANGPAGGTDGLDLCTDGPGYHVFAPGTGSAFFTEAWYTLCTFTATAAGIYPLQVKSSAIPGVTDTGGGYNAFSVRATSDGVSQPQVSPMTDMSIWLPQPGNGNYYLTSVSPSRAGKNLVIDLYDPGDGSTGPNGFQLQFLMPPSGLGTVPTGGTTTACSYNATPSATFGPATPDTSPDCTIETGLPNHAGGGIYNNSWLRVSIPIPTDYTCSTDCSWWVKYEFDPGTTPVDRTTWVVSYH